jgi:hypothetical protein
VAILVARSNDEIATGTGASEAWILALVLIAAAVASAFAARTSNRAGNASASQRRLPVGVVPALAAAVALAIVAGVLLEGSTERAATPPEAAGEAALDEDPAVRVATFESSRYRLWASSMDAYIAEPLTGIGAGSFSIWWANERSDDDERVADAHSLVLEPLAELGPIGLAALVAFIGLLVAAAIEARSKLRGGTEETLWAALVIAGGVIVVAAAIDWLWESGLVFALALTVLALAAVPALRGTSGGRWSVAWKFAAFGVALACFAIQVPVLVSTSSQEDAADAVLRGDFLSAAAEADRAIDAAPWAAEPYAIRAVVMLRAGEIEAARADALEAIDREPEELRFQALLQRIDAAD